MLVLLWHFLDGSVCGPLIRNYSCSWNNILPDQWQKGGSTSLFNWNDESLICLSLNAPKRRLLLYDSTSLVLPPCKECMRKCSVQKFLNNSCNELICGSLVCSPFYGVFRLLFVHKLVNKRGFAHPCCAVAAVLFSLRLSPSLCCRLRPLRRCPLHCSLHCFLPQLPLQKPASQSARWGRQSTRVPKLVYEKWLKCCNLSISTNGKLHDIINEIKRSVL